MFLKEKSLLKFSLMSSWQEWADKTSYWFKTIIPCTLLARAKITTSTKQLTLLTMMSSNKHCLKHFSKTRLSLLTVGLTSQYLRLRQEPCMPWETSSKSFALKDKKDLSEKYNYLRVLRRRLFIAQRVRQIK